MSGVRQRDRGLDPQPGAQDRPNGRGAWAAIVVMTVVVVLVGLLAAVWMYWLSGALPA